MQNPIFGVVLYVDLSSGQIIKSNFTKELAARYIGSRGYNAALLWELTPKDADPLGPDNVMIFGAGPLTGTNTPSSGRISVTAKSPATNLYLKTNVGGGWGSMLRYAGYSFIVIRGQAKFPVYLWIDDDKVAIRDARHLWGKDVRETEFALAAELGDSNIRFASIGPAGENLVMFSAVMCSNYNAAARGGIGAVMGSKKLKAIAVRGTQPVTVAEPDRFTHLVEKSWELFHSQSGAMNTFLYGTAGGVLGVNALGVFPSYNFQKSSFEQAEKISGQYLTESGLLTRRASCFSCPMSCHRYSEVKNGRFAGAFTGGPEYETFCAIGSGTGTSETEAVIKANEYCNLYGLDTISTGSVIQWIMECHQRNLEFDRDGLDLDWGNGETVVELVKRIAYRQGIGDLLAMGTKRASEKLGQHSEDWAIQAKGLEQSRVETRSAYSYALAFAVNPRGPDHLMTETLAEFGLSPEMIDLITKITGDRKYATPYTSEKRADIVRWHEDCYAITDSLGLCAFTSTAQYYMTPELMTELFSAATGIHCSEAEFLNLGRKIVVMERAYNCREGYTRKDDVLPKRLMTEPLEGRPAGQPNINSPEVMRPMLEEYYRMHGWNIQTGQPTRQGLVDLNLTAWADELERYGFLG